MKISIIVPVYNSSKTLKELIEKIRENLKKNSDEFEIFLIDDNSTDDSWNCINKLCTQNFFVKGIKLKSNFGQHNATMAGLNLCDGDYIIIMDDDLQHNPKYISQIVEKLSQGNDLCYCNYINREHQVWKILVSKINNLILSLGTSKPFHIYASPFRGISKSTKSAVIKNKERFIFLDILILNGNPKLTSIDIYHEKRADGLSQYNFAKLFKLWFQMLFCIKLNILNFMILMLPKIIAIVSLSLLNLFSKEKNQFVIDQKKNFND
tara:strand:+ start:189 stop:983 length:795 start_codon:yes stop_codon:yes gene_type:complete